MSRYSIALVECEIVHKIAKCGGVESFQCCQRAILGGSNSVPYHCCMTVTIMVLHELLILLR